MEVGKAESEGSKEVVGKGEGAMEGLVGSAGGVVSDGIMTLDGEKVNDGGSTEGMSTGADGVVGLGGPAGGTSEGGPTVGTEGEVGDPTVGADGIEGGSSMDIDMESTNIDRASAISFRLRCDSRTRG